MQELKWYKDTHSFTQIHSVIILLHLLALYVYMIFFFLTHLRSGICHGCLLLITSV